MKYENIVEIVKTDESGINDYIKAGWIIMGEPLGFKGCYYFCVGWDKTKGEVKIPKGFEMNHVL